MISIFDSNQFNQNLFFPREDSSAPPGNAVDIFIKVEENCKVHVRVYRNLQARFSILFFHGNGEIISDYNKIANYFLELGCEFIVCDYRGYGRSEGVPNLRSTLIDASIIYRYLRDNNTLNTQTCVMGRSLGSAPAIELCACFSDITCGVVESGYADPIPLVQRRGLDITDISKEDNALFNNSDKIRLAKCPFLIMHGEFDSLISSEEARLNFKNVSSENKKLDILKGVGHNDMMMAEDNAYFNSLSIFFTEFMS
jgi:pimeloyl-ACP methyl ester carboxylesterase